MRNPARCVLQSVSNVKLTRHRIPLELAKKGGYSSYTPLYPGGAQHRRGGQRHRGPHRATTQSGRLIEIVAGPLTDLIERGTEALTGSDCDPFYLGNISHP